MAGLSPRERYLTTCRHQEPDRVPIDLQPTGFLKLPGFPRRLPLEKQIEDVREADHFDFDIEHIHLDASPRLPERMIEETDELETYVSKHGYSCTAWKKKSGALHYFDHVSATPEGWKTVKKRMVLDVDGTARISRTSYFPPFTTYPSWEKAAEECRGAAHTDRYVLLGGYGPLEALWRHHGYVQTLMDFAEDQDLLIEMVKAHTDLVCAVIRKGVEVGIQPDGLFLAEDLGTTQGPLVSPEAFRRVLKPCYAKLFDVCREFNMARFMHSDGRIHTILDDLVETGLQVLNPIDTGSGMDLVELKKHYGKHLTFYGGISARDMHDVGKSNAQIDRCVPVAAKGGGFIYHSDHSVPPTVSLKRYLDILRRVRERSGRHTLA